MLLGFLGLLSQLLIHPRASLLHNAELLLEFINKSTIGYINLTGINFKFSNAIAILEPISLILSLETVHTVGINKRVAICGLSEASAIRNNSVHRNAGSCQCPPPLPTVIFQSICQEDLVIYFIVLRKVCVLYFK